MTIIDTHAHLDHVENVEQALDDAASAGVEAVLAVGVDLPANQKNLALKARTVPPRIFLGLGLHPGNIVTEEIEETLAFIEGHVSEAEVIGEIGLDFWYRWARKSDEKKKEQREVFRRQLMLAKSHGRPVSIHSRGAWQECLRLVRETGVEKGVFHWYSGPVDILKDILDAHFYVSCTPSLAYSPQAQEAMRYAPVERTLIETDCPVYFYADAQQADGFKSQPKDVWRTLEIYAALKKMDREKTRAILNHNAMEFLGQR